MKKKKFLSIEFNRRGHGQGHGHVASLNRLVIANTNNFFNKYDKHKNFCCNMCHKSSMNILYQKLRRDRQTFGEQTVSSNLI